MMPRVHAGHGWGKIILCGEHSVVAGTAAIALAVDRGLTVRLREEVGPTAIEGELAADARLRDAIRATLPDNGLRVSIHSDLPMGCGMGSSAALAVALLRARSSWRGEVLSPEALFEAALAVERVFHGNPSGVDNAVSARGGVLKFCKGTPPVLEPLPCPSWPLVVINSGTAGNTAELVAHVGSQRPRIDPILKQMGELVDRVARSLRDPVVLGPLLTENHRYLQQIGVSTPELDHLVALCLGAGALGAKLSGAGGGGVVIALAPQPQPVMQAAEAQGYTAFVVRPSRPT